MLTQISILGTKILTDIKMNLSEKENFYSLKNKESLKNYQIEKLL